MQVLIVSVNEEQQEYPLKQNIYKIGRDRSSSIVLKDNCVSRNHAYIFKDSDGAHHIFDGDIDSGSFSKNGITVNGIQTEGTRLNHGDKIQFSPTSTAVFIDQDKEKTIVIDPHKTATPYD